MSSILKKIIKSTFPFPIYIKAWRFIRFISASQYIGKNYECPFCSRSFKSFFPTGFNYPVLKNLDVVGGGYRKNVRCPQCNSDDRERLVYLFLKKNNFFKYKKSLLHIAPEKNLSIELRLSRNINYISADINSKSVDLEVDIRDIKLPDNTFDVIICNHVLEHIVDDGKAMRELKRVLKRGGYAILQVPLSYSISKTIEGAKTNTESDRKVLFGQKDHVRIYGKDYKIKLMDAGFSVQIHDFIKELGPEKAYRLGLNPQEKIIIGTKLF